MGLLKTILLILIVYYSFKFALRYVVPFLLRLLISRVGDRARRPYEGQRTVDIGKTVIDKKPTMGNPSSNSIGEYIDYEEIE